jgi:hypothetical protein
LVSPNITEPTLQPNFYYFGTGLGGGTIVQFTSEAPCQVAEYFTTIIDAGSATCPPPTP